jgi:anti-sigma factor RsiW
MKRRCEESVPLLGPLMDGELREEDRVWLAEHVSCCQSCAGRLALLAAQRDAIREAVVRKAASADLSRVADAVLARAPEERAPAPVLRLRVWGTEMWRERRGLLSAAAGLAVAASVAAVAILAPQLPGDSRRGALLADARNPGTTVEEVDFENHEGAVLQSGQTTVIWIDDDGPAVAR